MVLAKKLQWSPRVLSAAEDGPEVGWVAVPELHIDPKYQRTLDERFVKATIVDRYDPRQMEPLVVSRRSDGSCYVLDGQHRLAALRDLGVGVALCVIHAGLTSEEEAGLFLRLNSDRRPVNQWAKWTARLHSKEPTALAIERIVHEVGLKTGSANRSIGYIAAVNALDSIYASSPALLRFVLEKIVAFWPSDVRAYDGVFLKGLAMFVHSWSEQVDWGRFEHVFGSTPAADVMQTAKRLCTEQGYALGPVVVAIALRDIYNGKSNRKHGRIVGSPVSMAARRAVGYVRSR